MQMVATVLWCTFLSHFLYIFFWVPVHWTCRTNTLPFPFLYRSYELPVPDYVLNLLHVFLYLIRILFSSMIWDENLNWFVSGSPGIYHVTIYWKFFSSVLTSKIPLIPSLITTDNTTISGIIFLIILATCVSLLLPCLHCCCITIQFIFW